MKKFVLAASLVSCFSPYSSFATPPAAPTTVPVAIEDPVVLGEKAFEANKFEESYKHWRAHADKTHDLLTSFRVGMMLLEGRGTKPNEAEGLKYIKTSATKGFVPAQSFLGEAYFFGNGVPKDLKEAFKWFEMAALAGHPASQHKLGTMCQKGEGTTIDKKKAYKWIYLSANHLEGKVKSTAEQNLAAISEGMNKEEIESLRKEADAWHPKL